MRNSKIKINKTRYVESKHIIMWEVTYVDNNDDRFGKTVTLAYPANDLAAAFLNNPDIVITSQDAIEFNSNIEGKTINLIETFDNIQEDHILRGDTNTILDYNVRLREFPFEEVYDILMESD